MSSQQNLAAIGANAICGDTSRWATKKQVGAIAGRLNKHIKEILASRLGPSAGKGIIRELRLGFLNFVFDSDHLWSGDIIVSTSQLSFGAASALLDWLEGDSAAEDLAAWLMEQELPYAEVMFE